MLILLRFKATPTAEDKLSKSVLETSGGWDSVSSFNVATVTESLAAAAKGGLLIPAISSSHQSQ